MMEFLARHWEALLSPVSILLTYIFVKRKYMNKELAEKDSNINKKNLDTISANFVVYQDLVDDLEERFKKRIAELEYDLDKMKELNSELRKAVARQERYINKLLIKIDRYEQEKEENK